MERQSLLVGARSERGVSEATTQTIVLERKPDQRYVLGRELGRGGLGRVMLAMDRELMGKMRALDAKVKEAESKVKPYEDAESAGKKQLRAQRAELEEARWLGGEAFNQVLVTMTDALAFEPENAEVRRELGEFHYEQMVKAEKQRDRKTFAFWPIAGFTGPRPAPRGLQARLLPAVLGASPQG